MTTWSRRMFAGLLALSVAVGVGCTGSESPTEPVVAKAPDQLLGTITNTISNLSLLSCSEQPYAVTTQTVGPKGGTIRVGTHRLVIPTGALTLPVSIKAEQVPGRVNSVRFYPEGLKFERAASLTLSYGNCSPLLVLKRVVYIDEALRILELLPSVDDLRTKTVTGSIRHFSRYAVAW
jgi:hypothetical protein